MGAILDAVSNPRQADINDLKRKYRLSGMDLHGVGNVQVADLPEYGGNPVQGMVAMESPQSVYLNRNYMNRQDMAETLAHEAEHSRSMQSRGHRPSQYSTNSKGQPIDFPLGLLLALEKMKGGETVSQQPTAEELIAFIRGKEAVGEPINYQGVHPDAKRWVDANIFAGMPRFLEPTKEDAHYYHRPAKQTGALDELRRLIRSFTAK